MPTIRTIMEVLASSQRFLAKQSIAAYLLQSLVPSCSPAVFEKLRKEHITTALDLAGLDKGDLRELGLTMGQRNAVRKWAAHSVSQAASPRRSHRSDNDDVIRDWSLPLVDEPRPFKRMISKDELQAEAADDYVNARGAAWDRVRTLSPDYSYKWNRVRTPSPDYSYKPRSSFEVSPIILMPVFVQHVMEDFRVMEESPASQSPVAPLSEDFQTMDESPATQSPMAPLSDADIYAEDARISMQKTLSMRTSSSTDADEKTFELPPPPSPSLASVGTANHPHGCAAACKYASKARGCKDGPNCDRCHLCKYRDSKPPAVVSARSTWYGRRSKRSKALQ